MPEISPKPLTGVITYFEPFVDTSTITELDPKPSTGVVTYFKPLNPIRVKSGGTFKFTDASIKSGGIFEPGEIEQLPI